MSSTDKVSSPNPLKANYWTAKKWFTVLIVLLVAWGALYAIMHGDEGHLGYEYVSFSKNQIRQINRLLTTESSILQGEDNNIAADNANTDSLYPLSEATPIPEKYQGSANTVQTTTCDLDCRTEKVILFLNSEFEGDISQDQLNTIRKYIKTFGPDQVGIFLADHKVKVRSYFWLTGAYVYVEIVFWVIFGVICSLLFSVGNVVRRVGRNGGFNPNEIIYQVAKLFYAPFSAIIIVLAYSYFKNSATLNIDASEAVIVFAFLAGLYSGRVMNFFDKAKQVLLPANVNEHMEPQVVQPQTQPMVAEEVQRHQSRPQPQYRPHVDKGNVTDADILKEMDRASAASIEDKDDEKGIDEVDIDLKLDISGLFDEEKSQLQKLGFNKAIVTLHNVNGKDIIPARKLGDDMSTFVASGVRPGIYIARATLSQKLKDDNIINLFGEKTAYVTIDKPGLELYVKKYQSVE